MKGDWSKKKNAVHHAYYDIAKGSSVYDICETIHKRFLTLSITVLLQHPTPSKKGTCRLDYSTCGKMCIEAVLNKIAKDIHFVYDKKEAKHAGVEANC